jgi:UBA/TS-N domain
VPFLGASTILPNVSEAVKTALLSVVVGGIAAVAAAAALHHSNSTSRSRSMSAPVDLSAPDTVDLLDTDDEDNEPVLTDVAATKAAALAQVMEMGIDKETATAALAQCHGSVARAINHVFADAGSAAGGGSSSRRNAAAAAGSSSSAPSDPNRNCAACSASTAADSMQILDACSHMLCQQCIAPLQQQSKHPACPARGCGVPLASRDLALLLSPRELETLQSNALAAFKERLSDSFRCPQCSAVVQPGSSSDSKSSTNSSSNSKWKGSGKRPATSTAATATTSSSTSSAAEVITKHHTSCRCGTTLCCACRQAATAAAAAAGKRGRSTTSAATSSTASSSSAHTCTYNKLAVLLNLLTELELLVPDPDSVNSNGDSPAASSGSAKPAAKRARAAAPKPKAGRWGKGNVHHYDNAAVVRLLC